MALLVGLSSTVTGAESATAAAAGTVPGPALGAARVSGDIVTTILTILNTDITK